MSDSFQPSLFFECDWIASDCFRTGIVRLQKEYSFISLPEAYEKIKNDSIRLKKYAVLTFDDGYRSPLPTYLWLKEQGIPFTLFLNAKYLDGESGSSHVISITHSGEQHLNPDLIWKELYLRTEDLRELSSPLVSFASHGFEHIDATSLSEEEFQTQIKNNKDILKMYPQYIPFHAYTWGRHSDITDRILHKEGLLPVLMDGEKNYNDSFFIHRELFPLN